MLSTCALPRALLEAFFAARGTQLYRPTYLLLQLPPADLHSVPVAYSLHSLRSEIALSLSVHLTWDGKRETCTRSAARVCAACGSSLAPPAADLLSTAFGSLVHVGHSRRHSKGPALAVDC